MNWDNLKLNLCPHCGDKIEEHGEQFNCIVCAFKIDSGRKLEIEIHRAHPENRPTKKRHWQNLRDERCPICGGNLNYGAEPYEILSCLKAECSFKIRHDRFLEILADPNHSCNKFFERERIQKYGIEEEQ